LRVTHTTRSCHEIACKVGAVLISSLAPGEGESAPERLIDEADRELHVAKRRRMNLTEVYEP